MPRSQLLLLATLAVIGLGSLYRVASLRGGGESVALQFGPADYFSLMVFGLIAAVVLASAATPLAAAVDASVAVTGPRNEARTTPSVVAMREGGERLGFVHTIGFLYCGNHLGREPGPVEQELGARTNHEPVCIDGVNGFRVAAGQTIGQAGQDKHQRCDHRDHEHHKGIPHLGVTELFQGKEHRRPLTTRAGPETVP